MLLPELDQVRPERVVFGVLQGAEVAYRKLAEGVVGITGSFFNGIESAPIVFLFGAEFRVHGVAFTVHQFGGKQGCGELLRESVQGRFQKFGLNIEEIIRVLECSEGIVLAAMALDELLVFTWIRIFLGSKEQHVLQEVGESFPIRRIVPATDGNVHRGSRFVGILIRNQNHLQGIIQFDEPVLVIVIGALLRNLGCKSKGAEQHKCQQGKQA